MADQRVSVSREPIGSLLKRMFLVVLMLLNLSGLILLLLIFNRLLPLLVLEWAGIAALGVAAGLTARWQLRSHTLALKMLTAVLALAVNLWLLGWLSSGLVGFTVFKGTTLDVNWRGLGQLAFSSLLAGMALWAGRVSVHLDKSGKRWSKGKAPTAAKRAKPSPQHAQPRVTTGKPNQNRPAKKTPASRKAINWFSRSGITEGARNLQDPLRSLGLAATRFWKDSIGRLQAGFEGARASGQEARLTLRKRFTGKAEKSAVRLGGRPLKIQPPVARNDNSEIRLLGEIEHRCPFCLEIVEKNDKRGVKQCKICHTRHHADCWDVTGTCQVPHHYE